MKAGGHPNIVRAFNAKTISAVDGLHSGVDLSNLIDRESSARFYKKDELSLAYLRLEYCAYDDLFAYV